MPLGFHLLLEAGAIDFDLPLRRDLLGELDREAVRVVERERVLAAQPARAAPHQLFEPLQPGLERLDEGGFLARQDLADLAAMLHQLPVVVAEHLDRRLGAGLEEGLTNRQAGLRASARHGATQ